MGAEEGKTETEESPTARALERTPAGALAARCWSTLTTTTCLVNEVCCRSHIMFRPAELLTGRCTFIPVPPPPPAVTRRSLELDLPLGPILCADSIFGWSLR